MNQRTLFTSGTTVHGAARYLDNLIGDDLGLDEIVVSIAAFQLVESAANGRHDLIVVVNTRVPTAETTPPLFEGR